MDIAAVPALAALVYLAAYGARMPLLALRGLLRVRNLVLVVAPALALGVLALVIEAQVGGPVAAGAMAVAIVPAPLVSAGIVARLRGRMDLAGALVLGTIIVSLLVVGSRGSLAAGALFAALEVYAISAMFAGALPPLRDALLPVLRAVGWAAFVVVLAAAALVMPGAQDVARPLVDPSTVLVALVMFAAGLAVALAAAVATSREPLAAIAGAGLRDPALALALAAVTAGPEATGVPLIYAVLCLGAAALALMRR